MFDPSGLLFRKVSLPDSLPGSLFLHPMPGRYEEISTFISELENRNIRQIICLPSREEIAEISPGYLAFIKDEERRCAIECFPISDFGIPDCPQTFLDLSKKYAKQLQTGESILVHCRMGIGRTGLFAVTLLMASGLSRKKAIEIIRMSGAEPQTHAQNDLLIWVESHINEALK